jgi:hypothetical protein
MQNREQYHDKNNKSCKKYAYESKNKNQAINQPIMQKNWGLNYAAENSP